MSSGISDERLLDLYRVMVRIRAFENGVKRLIDEGTCGHVSLSTGGEAVAAGVSAHLTSEDQIGSTHRPLGHLVAKGCDLKRMMAEIMAKSTGTNRGKGGSYHIFDKDVGALGANGIVGGSVPMCAGYALANQLRGNGAVAVSYFGEGASNQGGVQETLNLAACWSLPVVFVCENSSPEVQRMLGHEIDYPQLSIDNVGDRGLVSGWLGLAAVLTSSTLYAVNRLAPGLSEGYMRFHCYAGFASVAFTALHAVYNLESLAGDWNGLTNLGLVLVIAGSGMLLRHVPDAGSFRFHSATLHPALVLALLVSMLFHVM